MYIPRGEWREFRLPRKRPGKPVCRLTNVSDGTARGYKHCSVVLRIPKGELPREVGYVRLDSSKYNEWQVLAYAEGRDDTLLRKEKELYECWLAEQPLAVERQEYTNINEADEGLGRNQRVRLTFQGQMTGDWYEHIPNEMELADYAHELAFLPDLTEPSSTMLDYTGPNVVNQNLSEDEQRKLVEVLQRHEGIMIASGNALPPPAYGV
ncbi:hypothetical protein PHMEG_00040780, partial [Phytophthora megakarya]